MENDKKTTDQKGWFTAIKIRSKAYYHMIKQAISSKNNPKNRPNHFYFVFIANLFIIIITFTFAIYTISLVTIMNNADATISKTHAASASDFSNFKTFVDIFGNNISKAYMSMFAGFLFGIFPIYFIYVNSQIIGVVSSIVYLGSGGPVILAGLLPHGITESIAIITSSGYGVWLGVKFFRMIFYKESAAFKEATFYALSKYVKIILPLLLFSAIIETYVTPLVVHHFSK